MNDTETPNLDALIYDLTRSHAPTGGATNEQLYVGVREALGYDYSILGIDRMVSRLRFEGMIRADRDKWAHVEFETMVSLG